MTLYCQYNATKIFESFVDQNLWGKLVHLRFNFQNDALKNLFILIKV